MATLAAPPEPAVEQVDFVRIAAAAWRNRWVAVVSVVIALVGAAVHLNRATYRYEASVVLVPAEQASTFSTEGLASLSAIIGVELTPQSGSGFALFREAAESLDVLPPSFPTCATQRPGSGESRPRRSGKSATS
jgi:hypothetical protein